MATPGNSGRTRPSRRRDAVALLKADHRQVKQWFAQFARTSNHARQNSLARDICHALRLHTTIEEEIFYPAFLEATHDKDIHHKAEVEHYGAKELVAEIERSSASDDYFRAKVNVLGEMIKHHVKEEEKSGGMFSEARKAKMDLLALGERLAERKSQLETMEKAA